MKLKVGVVIFLAGCVIGVVGTVAVNSDGREAKGRTEVVLADTLGMVAGSEVMPVEKTNKTVVSQGEQKPGTLGELLAMGPEELAGVDIARMNLLCAGGLPGSQDLEVESCLAILDRWAAEVGCQTELRLPRFRQEPAAYDGSEGKFRAVTMVLYLKTQLGVDYNQAIMQRETYPDARDVFIHGCLGDQKQGGCLSIPTLCVAVGRRLGYPLKLVATRQHVFFRWEEGSEVFNVEACCPGCDSHPDAYYRSWPGRISDADMRANPYLRSLSPSEELGVFLQTRGHCLFDAGRVTEAQAMYAWAYRLMPDSLDTLAHLNRALEKELGNYRAIYQKTVTPTQ